MTELKQDAGKQWLAENDPLKRAYQLRQIPLFPLAQEAKMLARNHKIFFADTPKKTAPI